MWNRRSSASSRIVIAITGVPSSMMMLVAYCAQMNSGSRNHESPGARIVWIVTMKLSPVRIDENPVMKAPRPTAITCVFA
jgi:hypothetical protein